MKSIISGGDKMLRRDVISLVVLALVLFLAFTADAATIWVSKADGNDSDDGLSEVNAKATIQAGVNAASNGDLILVKAGVYYENVTISGKNDLWLLSHPRGDATISAVSNSAARDGTETWTNVGDNRWEVSNGGEEPSLLAYFDGTTQWYLPWLKCADLNDHVVTGGGSCNSANPSIPEHGFCQTGGNIRARFPNNDDPNGEVVIIPETKFQGEGITLNNADDIIIDGFFIEAARDKCIDANSASTGTLVRNVEFEYCSVGARLSTGGTVEWTRYSHPGMYEYERAAAFDFTQNNAQAAALFQLSKEYDPNDDNNCTDPAVEGSFLQGHASTALTVNDVVTYSNFDGITMDGQSGSTYTRVITQGSVDNSIEFELDVGSGGLNNRVTEWYSIGLGFEPISFQTSSRIGATIDNCIVRFDSDDYRDNINQIFKTASSLNGNTTISIINCIFEFQDKRFFSNVGNVDTKYTWRNNVFIAEPSGGDGSPSTTVSNNFFVRNTCLLYTSPSPRD